MKDAKPSPPPPAPAAPPPAPVAERATEQTSTTEADMADKADRSASAPVETKQEEEGSGDDIELLDHKLKTPPGARKSHPSSGTTTKGATVAGKSTVRPRRRNQTVVPDSETETTKVLRLRQ